MREKCLDKGDELTLDIAISIGQNHETSQESLKIISKEEDSKVHSVEKRHFSKSAEQPHKGGNTRKPQHGRSPAERTQQRYGKSSQGAQSSDHLCNKCEYSSTHSKCPAKNERCSICHKLNHFAAVCCQRKSTHLADETEIDYASNNDYAHLISSVGDNNSNEWYETVKVAGKSVRMQIDTRAVQSIMPHNIFITIGSDVKLQPTTQKFESYSNHPLDVKGCVKIPTQYTRTNQWMFCIMLLIPAESRHSCLEQLANSYDSSKESSA